MCSSNKICVVLLRELCSSKFPYLLTIGCQIANSSKTGRFGYKMKSTRKRGESDNSIVNTQVSSIITL